MKIYESYGSQPELRSLRQARLVAEIRCLAVIIRCSGRRRRIGEGESPALRIGVGITNVSFADI
jgi:hypothetical protein